MSIENDCIELSNELIRQLGLKRDPIKSIIEIDGEFIWSIMKNVFNTNLLPNWNNLDCIDEIEEFQLIIITIEKIFDLDLNDINPAYLTMRKPKYIKLILNTLKLADNFIKNEQISLSNDTESLDKSTGDSNNFSNNYLDNSLSSESEFRLSEIENSIESNEEFEEEYKKKLKENDTKNLKLKNDELKRTEIDDKKSSIINKFKREEKSKEKSKEKSEVEFEKQLKELKDDQNFLKNFTCMKEKNFALELSYKIMEIFKIQEKTNEINSNLNKLQVYSSFLTNKQIKIPSIQPPSMNRSSNKFIQSKSKKQISNKKIISKNSKKFSSNSRQHSVNRKPTNTTKFDLNELINKLTGLSSKQIIELKDRKERQSETINQIKIDLIKKERNLNADILNRIERENKLLEMLKKEINLNLNEQTKNNLNDNENLKKAKCELRRERAKLSNVLDDYYRHSLSNQKNLEYEQDKQIRELTRKEDKLLRENLNDARNEIKEYEMRTKQNQKLILDDYDEFYVKQMNLIKQELIKQKGKRNDFIEPIRWTSPSISKHLEQSFKAKLYPKFN